MQCKWNRPRWTTALDGLEPCEADVSEERIGGMTRLEAQRGEEAGGEGRGRGGRGVERRTGSAATLDRTRCFLPTERGTEGTEGTAEEVLGV